MNEISARMSGVCEELRRICHDLKSAALNHSGSGSAFPDLVASIDPVVLDDLRKSVDLARQVLWCFADVRQSHFAGVQMEIRDRLSRNEVKRLERASPRSRDARSVLRSLTEDLEELQSMIDESYSADRQLKTHGLLFDPASLSDFREALDGTRHSIWPYVLSMEVSALSRDSIRQADGKSTRIVPHPDAKMFVREVQSITERAFERHVGLRDDSSE